MSWTRSLLPRRIGRSKDVEKLFDYIMTLNPIEGKPFTFHRLYPGANDRASGAWVWYVTSGSGLEVASSQFTLKEVLKAIKENRISITGRGISFELIVENEKVHDA